MRNIEEMTPLEIVTYLRSEHNMVISAFTQDEIEQYARNEIGIQLQEDEKLVEKVIHTLNYKQDPSVGVNWDTIEETIIFERSKNRI